MSVGTTACAIATDRSVVCWGAGPDSSIDPDYEPDGNQLVLPSQPLYPPIHDVAEVSAGSDQICARRRDNSVWCWGTKEVEYHPTPCPGFDIISIGNPFPEEVPTAAPEVALSQGDGSVYALDATGTVSFLYPSTSIPTVGSYPLQAIPLPGTAGTVHVRSDGFLSGLSSEGKGWWLLVPTLVPPPAVPGPTPTPLGVDLGPLSDILAFPSDYIDPDVCAIRASDGTVWCGSDDTHYAAVPGLTDAVKLAGWWWPWPDDRKICALRRDGSIWCWHGSDAAPAPVTTACGPLRGATDISTNGFYGCALVSGIVYCWGDIVNFAGGPLVPPPVDPLLAEPVRVPCTPPPGEH